MNNTRLVTYILAIVCIALFTIGYIIGYKAHKCTIVVKEVKVTDTINNYVPITGGAGSPVTVITKPNNKPIIEYVKVPNYIKGPVKYITKKDIVYKQASNTFTSIDTFKIDSLFIYIKDTGNCEGITGRQATLGGKVKEKIVTTTVTKVVSTPPPFITWYGGVMVASSIPIQPSDIGIATSVIMQNKTSLGLTYGLSSKQFTLTFLSKIK